MEFFFRTRIHAIIKNALENLFHAHGIENSDNHEIRIEYPPNPEFGDYSTPIAMELAKVFKMNPRKIGEEIVKEITALQNKSDDQIISDMRVEGPGFINFFISNDALAFVFKEGWHIDSYLQSNLRQAPREKSVNLEFVSANPTGPLNIVSSRAAVLGDTIARILIENGFNVTREYYVNDYGNQVYLLGRTFVYRYAQKMGVEVSLPEDHYQGEYVIDYLEKILQNGDLSEKLLLSKEELHSIFSDEARLKEYLESASEEFGQTGLRYILSDQKKDLENFKVSFDVFFSEKTLHESGKVEEALDLLKKNNEVYEDDGAVYFRATAHQDEKDRVLVRSDKRPTYFLADIAYHIDKINRGSAILYDIWGPDHHGYIPRLTGALEAAGMLKQNQFSVLIAQQVNLIENGKQVEMSKRLGKFQTMRDLSKSIPLDAARYFFLMRSSSTPLDFDLDLAKDKSNKNPVYYIQYAHARIHSIFREALAIQKTSTDKKPKIEFIQMPNRRKLIMNVLKFAELLEDISRNLEVHRLPTYLYDLASDFTTFYHDKQNRILEILQKNPDEAEMLIVLLDRVRMVMEKGLALLGISAPKKM